MFMDDYSRFGYVYLMHRKSNALDEFIEYKENQKTNWVNISRHFDLIEMESTCLLSLILSLRSMGLYPN